MSAGAVVVDLDAGLREPFAGLLEAGAGEADRHPGDERTRVVEGLHGAAEALLGVDVGAAEHVLLGHAAVLEAKRGGVRGADAELVLEAVELQAGVGAFDDERLDRGAALGAVERGPDDDEVGALAGGDVDLLAVEDVLVAVEHGGGANRGGVRAGLGLGDRHRGPAAVEALQLLLVGDGGDRGVAEALARHREQQPDVAPAQLHDAEHRRHVRAVAVGAVAGLRVAAHAGGAGAGVAAGVHAVDHRGEHVELLGVLVLGEVVLARDRTEDLGGDLVGLADERRELLRVSRD